MRHAHPVGLHEEVVEQIRAEVEVQQPVERLGALGARPDRPVVGDRPAVALVAEQGVALGVLDVGDPGAVCVGQAEFGNPGEALHARRPAAKRAGGQ